MSTTTALTEQLSLRLSQDQREYLRREVARLRKSSPPVRVNEADVIRMLIDRQQQRDYEYSQGPTANVGCGA